MFKRSQCPKIIVRLLLISAIGLSFLAYGGESPGFGVVEPETIGIPSQKLNILSNQIHEWIADDEIVGAEMLIIKSKHVVFHEVFGWRDREQNLPWEKNTISRIYSMTKPIVGTSILLLAQQGKLSLSDTVAKHVPAFRNKRSRHITIQQLLQHIGGFELPGYPGAPYDYESLKELVSTIGHEGPTLPPGEWFHYSDAGSSTLAYIVTLVSGMPVEDFIQSHVFSPLGMEDSFFNLNPDDPRRHRISCTYKGGKNNWKQSWDNTRPPVVSYFRGSGGIYTTAMDYARFLSVWMDNGQTPSAVFLTPETIQAALTPSIQSIVMQFNYGYQWQLFYDTQKPFFMFGHAGAGIGTTRPTSVGIAVPEDELVFLFFTQSDNNTTVERIGNLVKSVFY